MSSDKHLTLHFFNLIAPNPCFAYRFQSDTGLHQFIFHLKIGKHEIGPDKHEKWCNEILKQARYAVVKGIDRKIILDQQIGIKTHRDLIGSHEKPEKQGRSVAFEMGKIMYVSVIPEEGS